MPRCARVAFGFGVPEHDRPQLPQFGGWNSVDWFHAGQLARHQ